MDYIPSMFIAYLIGSIPFGFLLTGMIKRADIRRYGSGNIGATNVMRVMGWRAGMLVFLLDAAKGAAAVLIARMLSPETGVHLAAGLAVLAGHSFPVFLKFRGGKGAATSIGLLIPLAGWITLLLLLIFGAVVAVTRFVSLGSILGACSLPFLFWAFGYSSLYILFGVAVGLLVILRHHSNIARLLQGTESKLGRKKETSGEGES